MKRLSPSLLLMAWSLVVSQSLQADQTVEQTAIRNAVASYVQAFNAKDAAALAAHWSPDAIYTNPVSGEQVVGRAAIEQQFAAIFADEAAPKLVATTDSVQFISPGVAIEHGTATVTRPEQTPEESRYTAVYVKRDGEWLLDRVSEEDTPVVLSNYEHLQELEWMIGTWVDGDDQSVIETTCQWTKNRNFITRMYALRVGDRIEVSGMQIVGWDPAAQQIRSWVFDSDGGFGQGVWRRKDKTWYIQMSGTAPDGSNASSVNVITYVDDNTFTWQALNRQAGGELLPNVDEVVVVRQTTPD